MKEYRLEVLSESEAREFCKINNYRFVELYFEDGKLMLLAEIPGSEDDNIIDEIYSKAELEDCLIFTLYDGHKMYISDKRLYNIGVTFNVTQAKRFKKSVADKKVRAMNRHRGYHWICWQLR